MKDYAGHETNRKLLSGLPVLARLDGRAFHAFCHGLERPYDWRLATLLQDTAQLLLEETQAVVAYTQSDEITLAWDGVVFMDGKIHKMTSLLAALCSAVFGRLLPARLPEKVDRLPTFDCRVWVVPNQEEATNAFLWRELDAARNSISAAARSVYSHREVQGKGTKELQELLHVKGINWNDYPTFFKRGTFFRRTRVLRQFAPEELAGLPPKHAARSNPNLEVERWVTTVLDMPPFSRVANRVQVLFAGETPVTRGAADR